MPQLPDARIKIDYNMGVKNNFFWILALCLIVLDCDARGAPRIKPSRKEANSCSVSISPKDQREMVILKVQQRLDCIEAKLDELARQEKMIRHFQVGRKF